MLLITMCHLFTQIAFACECPPPSGKVSKFIKNKTIFHGKAIKSEVTRQDGYKPDIDTNFTNVYTLTSPIELGSAVTIKHYGANSCYTSFTLNHFNWVIAHKTEAADWGLQHNVCLTRQHEYILPIINYLKTGQDNDIRSGLCGYNIDLSDKTREERITLCEDWKHKQFDLLTNFTNNLPKPAGFYVRD